MAVVPADAADLLTAHLPVTWLPSGPVRAASVPIDTSPDVIAAWHQTHFREVPLIPLRGHQAMTTEQAAAWLDEHASVLAWFLEDIAGRAEWHLTAQRDPALPPVELPAEEAADTLAAWVWRRVRAGSDDACPLPIPAPAAAAGQFAHGAVLVAQANEANWLAALEQFREELKTTATTLEYHGPYPAYHFTPFAPE